MFIIEELHEGTHSALHPFIKLPAERHVLIKLLSLSWTSSVFASRDVGQQESYWVAHWQGGRGWAL